MKLRDSLRKTMAVVLVLASSSSGFYWPEDHVPPPSALASISTSNRSSSVVEVSIILPMRYRTADVELHPAMKRAGAGVLVGFREAVRRGLLRDVYFNVTLRDSRCDITYGPKSFTDAVVEGAHVLFGPSCDYSLAPVARMIKFYNLPLLTAGGFAYDFTEPKAHNESEFHLLTKTGFSFTDVAEMTFQFFDKMKWNRTKLMYRKDDHQSWSGANTCTQLMSAMVVTGKRLKVQMDEVKLDVTEKLYPNDTVMLQNNLHDYANVFLGPVSPYVLAPVSRYAGVWKTPVLSTGGQETSFRSKAQYPMLTTVGGTYSQLAKFVARLLHNFDWHIVSFLYHTYPETSGKGKSPCHFTLGEVYMQMGGVKNDNLTYESFDGDAMNVTSFESVLNEVKTKARVVILCASPPKVREILLAAEGLGLMDRGEYVFFNVELFASRQSELYTPWNVSTASEEENARAKKAYEAVLTVTADSADSAQFDDFAASVKQLSKDMFNHTYSEDVNIFVANFHDAVLLYATALNETITEHGIEYKSRGDIIVPKMWNRTIVGVTGNVSINSNGDRSADYALLDLNPKTGKFEPVAVYRGRSNSFEQDRTHLIHWPQREELGPPSDMPECGFDGSLCDQESQLIYILSGVFSGVVIALIVGAGFIYRYYKQEADLAQMTWKIREDDILPSNFQRKGQFGSRTSIGRMSVASADSLGRPGFIRTGIFKGSVVALKTLKKERIVPNRKLLMELKTLKDLQHDHLVRFIGACIDGPDECFVVTEYCTRGSLQDILEADKFQLDSNFRRSLVHDIVKGMHFLHMSEIKLHGNLKSSNCVVDGRFVVKLTDFGLHALRTHDEDCDAGSFQFWRKKLWTSPELLRAEAAALAEGDYSTEHFCSAKGDVYAFGIIVHEIVTRKGVFYLGEDEHMEARDIIEGVRRGPSPLGNGGPALLCPTAITATSSASSGLKAGGDGGIGGAGGALLRPSLDESVDGEEPTDNELVSMMTQCWAEDPLDRPDFSALKVAIRKLNKDNESSNILDNLLTRMERFANNLESLVEERTQDYLIEKEKCENLLYELLPKSVAGQLIAGNSVIAETYNSVTIYFSDIVGFTSLSAESTPLQVVDLLNDLYTCFDKVIGTFDVYKVETIGDAYMVVSGLPVPNENNHAREIARMSLKLLEKVQTFIIKHRPDEKLKLRIGLHSGSCCAGVVGVKMPRYCLFGDTVNTASRMESNGLPLKIHVSPTTKEVLDSFGTFDLECRGEVEMKGKGRMKTYWLLGERAPPSVDLPQITTTSTSSDGGPHDHDGPPDYTTAITPVSVASSAVASSATGSVSVPRVRAHFEDETVTTFIDAACSSSACSTPRSQLPNGNAASLMLNDEYCGSGANGGSHSFDNCSESEPLTSNGRLRHAV